MSTATEKTYAVEGMTCGHCEVSVRAAVAAAGYGVASVIVPRPGYGETSGDCS